jgi:hypothetical protein
MVKGRGYALWIDWLYSGEGTMQFYQLIGRPSTKRGKT